MERKRRIKTFLLLFTGEFLFAVLLTFLIVMFQLRTNDQTLMDAVMVTGIVFGLFGWIIFLSNVGLVEVFEYIIMVVTCVVRREPITSSYFEMVYLREKNHSVAHRTILLTAAIFLTVGSVLYYRYYN